MTPISCAAGSIARMTMPVAVRCIPRNENGSLCRPSRIAAASGSIRRSTLSLPGLGQNAEDALKRDVDPAGTVRQFVGDFVNGFLEGKERQHHARLALAGRI